MLAGPVAGVLAMVRAYDWMVGLADSAPRMMLKPLLSDRKLVNSTTSGFGRGADGVGVGAGGQCHDLLPVGLAGRLEIDDQDTAVGGGGV